MPGFCDDWFIKFLFSFEVSFSELLENPVLATFSNYFPFSVFLGIFCVFVYMQVYECMCGYVCMCTWRPEADAGAHPLLFYIIH